MEIGNVSKRKQPDQSEENGRRPQMGLQHREKSRNRRWASGGPYAKNVY